MSKRTEQMKDAQKLSRKIEKVCDDPTSLFDWFEGSHIGTFGIDALERAHVIFGDCPSTELELDAKGNKAYVYVGRFGKARVPQRAMWELREFFNALHNC